MAVAARKEWKREVKRKAIKYKRPNLYIACEEINFIWQEKAVEEFREMWREGYSIHEMAEYFQRGTDEVMILAMDQSRHHHIKSRPGGVWGI
ncbi:helix-turn-helix domain containing protein [Paenibacillus taichungensis]|uniref:helix-turn-helix domain containing protein n=1 Tax=Paenibacillus taichungensis TaxID=484184 RepID=UPI00380F1CB1